MSNQSDFEKWQRQWDAAAEQFAKESANELAATARKQHDNQLQTSFFTDTPMDRDYQEPPLEDELSWHDIYARSQNIDGLITDSVEYTKGAEKPHTLLALLHLSNVILLSKALLVLTKRKKKRVRCV